MSRRRPLRWLVPLAVAAVLLGAAWSHFASSKPDGLEKIAEQQKFAKNEKPIARSPMPDYDVPVLGGRLGKTLAGLAGVLLAFGLVYGVGRLLTRRQRKSADLPERGAPDPEAEPRS